VSFADTPLAASIVRIAGAIVAREAAAVSAAANERAGQGTKAPTPPAGRGKRHAA
jgi:hypothetical protein